MKEKQTEEKPKKKRIRRPKPKKEKESKELLSPQRQLCISLYTDPKSETFGNLYKSIINAGFSESYAHNIYGKELPEWLIKNVGRMGFLLKAERNLGELLDMPVNVLKGKKVKIVTTDPKLVAIKADMSKFSMARLGKVWYSERTEHTGKDGGAIETKINYDELTDEQLRSEIERRNNRNA